MLTITIIIIIIAILLVEVIIIIIIAMLLIVVAVLLTIVMSRGRRIYGSQLLRTGADVSERLMSTMHTPGLHNKIPA